MIRNIRPEDAAQICEIYNYYIENSIVTFEETPVTSEEMKSRIIKNTSKHPWIVYKKGDNILGYAYASDWKSRCAYKHSVETTVYLRQEAQGNGIGTILYKELIKLLKDKNLHAAIGGIALPNEASIALHEKLGFEKIGQFREVGYKFNNWIDVGYWELIFK
jgi:phosphinothricin acetyltransferase